jgi:hypothetical protein
LTLSLRRSTLLAPAVLLAAILGTSLAPRSALAAPKDAQAEKALKQAMEEDYLETRFDKAEQRLRAAIEACGPDGCGPKVKARLFIALGTVLGGGKSQLDDARDAFVDALRLDAEAALDPDLIKTEITYAFEKARAELKMGTPAAPATVDTLSHTAPPEQQAQTPVPLHVQLPPDLLAKTRKVTVSYLAPGAADWKSLVMKKVGEFGFGINVPCADLGKAGPLQYHLAVTGDGGAVLAEAGSRKAPLTTVMKDKITGEPPRWPGFAPPERCGNKIEAGPSQCLDDRQCNSGFVCTGGVCASKSDGTGGSDRRSNWFTVTFAPDISIVSGDEVCSAAGQQEDHFVCVREDGSRYLGTPATGEGSANNVNTGLLLSTLRVALAYDRVLLDNVAAGLRVGFAFNGTSDGGASFLPLHLEARASYWFGAKPFESLGARPFLMVSGGLAQVDSKTDVQVLESDATCGVADMGVCANASPDGVRERQTQTLTASKQAGQGFVGGGGGITYAPIDAVALHLALRVSVTLPVVTAVFSPEAGASVGF